eukprot:NODE_22417_length_709_cov_3.768041.p2 GENE.NODE_22417_length_709_cov_3.768041~~NODE_22417_length_709_cov_3.768041.p2  ORF type:complete len:159 (-),score=44.19 NODE_22417_length_709_cov_3.768041:125-601(-)
MLLLRVPLRRTVLQLAARVPAVVEPGTRRGFAEATAAAAATTAKEPGTRQLETWEEVELHRPLAPTLEGYVRPAGAPEQLDIPREQYHQFMLGKPARLSHEFKNFILGFGILSFMAFEFAFTMYKMQPDDMEWIDEERKRAAAAKARFDAKLAEHAQE